MRSHFTLGTAAFVQTIDPYRAPGGGGQPLERDGSMHREAESDAAEGTS